MRFSLSLSTASAIRRTARHSLALHTMLTTWAGRLANRLEDDRILDRPMPWLAGLLFAFLLLWLVRGARH